LTRGQAAAAATLTVVQLGASAAGVEHEPFFSNYAMYSRTYASTQAFNHEYERNSRSYLFFAVDERGCATDVTESLDRIPMALPQATALIESLDRGETPPPAASEAVARALAIGTAGMTGVGPASEVAVYAVSRQFDFERGEFREPDQRLVASFRAGTLTRSDRPIRRCP
jgi:hypothetical protein